MNVNEQKTKWVGVLTWILVGISSVLWEAEYRSLVAPRAVMLFGAFLVFGVAFLIGTRPGCTNAMRIPMVIIETLAAYWCVTLQPTGFQPVLLVIIAAQLGAFPPRFAVIAIAVNSLVLAFIMASNGGSPVIYALVYFAFSLFALFSMNVARSEMEARKSLAQANAELRMTTELLEISSRTSERLRIARDLHDLLGHHLTALSLNLEVAGHLAEGKAQEHVRQSHTLAKLLLTDVREAVSEMREERGIDLSHALRVLAEGVPALQVELDLPEDLAIDDPDRAQVLLRCAQEIITNTVRHAGANRLRLKLSRTEGLLRLEAADDGRGCNHTKPGNGLRGMRERLSAYGGQVDIITASGQGFALDVRIPLEAVP